MLLLVDMATFLIHFLSLPFTFSTWCLAAFQVPSWLWKVISVVFFVVITTDTNVRQDQCGVKPRRIIFFHRDLNIDWSITQHKTLNNNTFNHKHWHLSYCYQQACEVLPVIYCYDKQVKGILDSYGSMRCTNEQQFPNCQS